MAKQSITVELDDKTIDFLAALGKPVEMLAQLAYSATTESLRRPGHERRAQTDASLRVERDKTDVAIAKELETVEGVADDVVRIARQRADQVVQTARDDADSDSPPQSTATEASLKRARADGLVGAERSKADAVLADERVERRHDPQGFLAGERRVTDKDLTGERTHADTLVVDQREANSQMVSATILAHELALDADVAKEQAEKRETELRELGELREMFIGILGHDLRSPLNSIVLAATQLVKRGRLDDSDAETAARIISSSHRITRMITQTLDLTRARLGGGLPIEVKPTDLREVCRNVVHEFDTTIQLEVEGDVTGTWDPDRLTEALSNMTGNAIEYAAPETVVAIKAHADGAAVVVEISNRGTPIPADILPFIFEPFRRAQQREKSVTGNLGLGLYIAQQIVLSHGGTLDVHSANGTTTFVMRLLRRSALPLAKLS